MTEDLLVALLVVALVFAMLVVAALALSVRAFAQVSELIRYVVDHKGGVRTKGDVAADNSSLGGVVSDSDADGT